jgi:hypothetical protein
LGRSENLIVKLDLWHVLNSVPDFLSNHIDPAPGCHEKSSLHRHFAARHHGFIHVRSLKRVYFYP